jgi:hypothetical protein
MYRDTDNPSLFAASLIILASSSDTLKVMISPFLSPIL